MSKLNRATKILMASAHLYPDDFSDELNQRLAHPYKVMSPELGLDIRKIQAEVIESKKITQIKSALIIISILFGIFLQSSFPGDDTFFCIMMTYSILFIIEFFFLLDGKSRARTIMQNISENDEHYLEDNTNKNVIISGGYSPFIGSGTELDNNWSFTVNLRMSESSKKTVGNLSIAELHNHVQHQLHSLNIDGLKIKDEIYINGLDVNLLKHIQPRGRMRKPVTTVDRQYILKKINGNEKRERHYRVVRVPMWGGQIIISMYYRFLIRNQSLFIESRVYMLPPIKKKYLQVEEIMENQSLKELKNTCIDSIIYASYYWLIVLYKLLRYVFGGFMGKYLQRKVWSKEFKESRLYNYGWPVSFREIVASKEYERYFQSVDQDVNMKLITSEFIQSVKEFLTSKNISTEQFTQTTTKIYNEGVIVSGGLVKSSSMAAGKRAMVKNLLKARAQG